MKTELEVNFTKLTPMQLNNPKYKARLRKIIKTVQRPINFWYDLLKTESLTNLNDLSPGVRSELLLLRLRDKSTKKVNNSQKLI